MEDKEKSHVPKDCPILKGYCKEKPCAWWSGRKKECNVTTLVMDNEKKNILKLIHESKDFERLEFDYFKHLSTISLAGISVLGIFLKTIFSKSSHNPIIFSIACLSILAFIFCVVWSVLCLSGPANNILYKTESEFYGSINEEDNCIKAYEKFKIVNTKLINDERIIRYSFLFGFLLFVLYLIINLTLLFEC